MSQSVSRPSSPLPRALARRSSLAGWLAVVALLLGSVTGVGAQISGEVVDVATRQPVAFANVALVDSAGNVWAQVVTDSTGYFSVIPMTNEEVFDVQVIAMGYSGVQVDPIHWRGVPVHRTIGIVAQPISLEGINVEVEGQDVRLLLFGYYDRKERGFGHFIDREQILNTVEPGVTGILRGTPGLLVRGNREVVAWRNTGGQLQGGLTQTSSGFNGPSRSRSAQFCRPTVFVNGSLDYRLADSGLNDFSNAGAARSFNDFLPDPEDIIGVEFYRSMASIPRELQIDYERFRSDPTRTRIMSQCGVILIWTSLQRIGG